MYMNADDQTLVNVSKIRTCWASTRSGLKMKLSFYKEWSKMKYSLMNQNKEHNYIYFAHTEHLLVNSPNIEVILNTLGIQKT